MKGIEEIQIMLVDELIKVVDKVKSNKKRLDYYNEILGDTSFLLASLLELLLKKNYSEWDQKKWIDDSLITKVEVKKNNNALAIWGIMIWGLEDTTEQWTDPFYFEIELMREEMDFGKFIFYFSDVNTHEVSYEDFAKNRNCWDINIKNWKYKITSR